MASTSMIDVTHHVERNLGRGKSNKQKMLLRSTTILVNPSHPSKSYQSRLGGGKLVPYHLRRFPLQYHDERWSMGAMAKES